MGKKVKLQKISKHVWIFPFDSPKDRPNLGYIYGTKMALAVDAGHSSKHVEEFYDAILAEGLSLPEITVITHWHWDHTYGMHAVSGKTMARPETNTKLAQIRQDMSRDPDKVREFLNSDPSIQREYAGGVPVVVVPAEETIMEDHSIDLGGVTAELMLSESPHTDDALLVYVPEDRVLFVGDAQLGEFPSWKMNWKKLASFAKKVQGIDADVIIDGHWKPYTKEEFMADIM
ncbi:MAG: MBL fold metallo-hydrolase [Lachnospiraceae bacterium]|nr:MBL fold metallo-hydrolase [Lachnospiraceae bacterium]